jgi:hypothetical protein
MLAGCGPSERKRDTIEEVRKQLDSLRSSFKVADEVKGFEEKKN